MAPQTGATRYQKFLKSEKSKTKLKGKSKELPKGTNVTKTNFKVKKIVIKEQLKQHAKTEALSVRKLSVKELLSRLTHHNTHTRTEALSDLKDIISSLPEVLENNLGELIKCVTPLILNIEKSVRQESLKVLHVILSHASIGRVDPFFDILCTFLRSAMTDLNARIQEDSLLFLDSLLATVPDKVAQDFHKIIPNFLHMISKFSVEKSDRVISVNLGSQITSVKWRVKVLHRLKDYLQQYVKCNGVQDVTQKDVNTTKFFDPTKINHYSLFNPIYIKTCNVSCFSSKNLQDSVPLDEVEKFKGYIDTLMRLLFDTWLEECPSGNSKKNIETVVNEDAASLLKNILDVMSLLWHLIKHLNNKYPNSNILKTFSVQYRQLFLQHFVSNFPYVTNIRSKQRSTPTTPLEDAITDPKLVLQNLEICYLFIVLNPFINVKTQNKDIISVLSYIENTFNQNTQDEVNDEILQILNTIFSNEINSWTKTTIVMEKLLKKIIVVYFDKTTSSSVRQNIFSILCKIALNDKLIHFHECDAYKTWLQNLPDILLEETMTMQTIDIIHKFAVRNNRKFNAIIMPKLRNIVENLPKLTITGAENNICGYYKLFSLLHYIVNWDDESLNVLEQQLLNSAYKNDYVSYIYDIMRSKIK